LEPSWRPPGGFLGASWGFLEASYRGQERILKFHFFVPYGFQMGRNSFMKELVYFHIQCGQSMMAQKEGFLGFPRKGSEQRGLPDMYFKFK